MLSAFISIAQCTKIGVGVSLSQTTHIVKSEVRVATHGGSDSAQFSGVDECSSPFAPIPVSPYQLCI